MINFVGRTGKHGRLQEASRPLLEPVQRAGGSTLQLLTRAYTQCA